jgi:LysR family transcriptional regulator, glycine cleavage system transcriptional activator
MACESMLPSMTSRLPSLRAVAIFVAAGRALSFTAAAKTVNLTPSAVSRRIRDLERELGTALFRRFNRRLELTPAGARYLAGVSQAIELIERESEAIRPRRRGATLRLSVLQSFASLWLLPRLAAFKSARPEIDVQVETSTELVDLVDERFDAAIRFGTGRWPGLLAERLFPVRVFPLAAPGLLAVGKPATAAVLDSTTLLEIAQSPDLWPQYLAGIGLGGYRPRCVQTFDNAQVMFAAVANGLGLALGARELLERQLKSGRLVTPFSNPPVTIRQSYYLVYPKDRQDQPALKALRRALLGEAERPRMR